MLGLQKTIYSTPTSEGIATSYRQESPLEVDIKVLGNTISHGITRVRDSISSLEQLTQDPRTIRGEKTHLNRRHARGKKYLRLQDMNAQTEAIRDAHFSGMINEFKNLDDYTDRLGVSIELLSNYAANSLKGQGYGDDALTRVKQFTPEAQYNKDTGKIEFRAANGEYAPLTSFAELDEVGNYVGNNKIAQSLLELKLAGAALKATIDASILKYVTQVQNYPGDTHSEVVDAVQTVEANLGYLSSQNLPRDLSDLIKKSTPSRITQGLQKYVDHKANPWFARIVGGIGITTGVASLILGVPQTVEWVSRGYIDLG